MVSDLVRENGWADGNDYKIRFTYNLVTKVDYPHLIVDTMQFAIQEIKAMPESDRLALHMKVGLSSMMSGLYFANAEEMFGTAVYLTVSMMNDYSIKPDSPAGTKIPRQVTFTYRKTEKGWKKLDCRMTWVSHPHREQAPATRRYRPPLHSRKHHQRIKNAFRMQGNTRFVCNRAVSVRL